MGNKSKTIADKIGYALGTIIILCAVSILVAGSIKLIQLMF